MQQRHRLINDDDNGNSDNYMVSHCYIVAIVPRIINTVLEYRIIRPRLAYQDRHFSSALHLINIFFYRIVHGQLDVDELSGLGFSLTLKYDAGTAAILSHHDMIRMRMRMILIMCWKHCRSMDRVHPYIRGKVFSTPMKKGHVEAATARIVARDDDKDDSYLAVICERYYFQTKLYM
jgi:hypothetical protein